MPALNPEIADTSWKRMKGLMFRKSPGRGMLFVFDEPCFPGIWMLGMRFRIDIVFLDSERRVVDFFENARPVSLNPRSWRIYKPRRPARYALELPAGSIRKMGISEGKKIDIRDF